MKLRVSGRARLRIRRIDEWWRRERPENPDGFKQELDAACARILRAPTIRAPHAEISGTKVWRVLMQQTEQHVYYTVDDVTAEIVIETVWGARRGRAPKL